MDKWLPGALTLGTEIGPGEEYTLGGGVEWRRDEDSDFAKLYASAGILTLVEGGFKSVPSSPIFSIDLCLCFFLRWCERASCDGGSMRYCSGSYQGGKHHQRWISQVRTFQLTGPGRRRNPNKACPDKEWNSLLPISRWSRRCLSLVSVESIESNSPKWTCGETGVHRSSCFTYLVYLAKKNWVNLLSFENWVLCNGLQEFQRRPSARPHHHLPPGDLHQHTSIITFRPFLKSTVCHL